MALVVILWEIICPPESTQIYAKLSAARQMFSMRQDKRREIQKHKGSVEHRREIPHKTNSDWPTHFTAGSVCHLFQSGIDPDPNIMWLWPNDDTKLGIPLTCCGPMKSMQIEHGKSFLIVFPIGTGSNSAGHTCVIFYIFRPECPDYCSVKGNTSLSHSYVNNGNNRLSPIAILSDSVIIWLPRFVPHFYARILGSLPDGSKIDQE